MKSPYATPPSVKHSYLRRKSLGVAGGCFLVISSVFINESQMQFWTDERSTKVEEESFLNCTQGLVEKALTIKNYTFSTIASWLVLMEYI